MPRGQWALLGADMLVLLTSQHVWWSLALVVGTPNARLTRRELFAPYSLRTYALAEGS